MADNLTLPAAGSVIATKDLSSVHFQKFLAVDDAGNIIEVVDVGGVGTGPWALGTTNLTVQEVLGMVAHDVADDANEKPLKLGAVATALSAASTFTGISTGGDKTKLMATSSGVLFTLGGGPFLTTVRAQYTSTQTNAAIVTISTGTKLVVTRVSVACNAALTAATSVLIGFGLTTTPTTAGVVYSHPGIGGAIFSQSVGSGAGVLGAGADNEDLRITTGTITAGALDVAVTYAQMPF
jgi:hypothetical protein